MPKKRTDKTKLTRLQRFSLFFFDHIKTSVALWIAVVIFGVLSYTVFLERQGFPGVNLPFSIVNGAYFVDDQAKVDKDIAEPVSRAILSMPEVKTVTTSSAKNFVNVQIEYKEGTDSVAASAKAQKQVEALGLPKAAQLKFQSIDFTKFDNKYNLLLSVYGTSNIDQMTLKTEANNIANQLKTVEGVVKAEPLSQTEQAVDPTTGQSKEQQKTFDRTGVSKDGKIVLMILYR